MPSDPLKERDLCLLADVVLMEDSHGKSGVALKRITPDERYRAVQFHKRLGLFREVPK